MKKLFAKFKPWLLRLFIIPPIVIGASILVFFAQNRLQPERVAEQETARSLRVITVPKMDYLPRTVGYGTSQPARVWQAVCEVKGRIVQLHPELKEGSFVSEGEMLARIDDTDIKLAIGRLKSEISKTQANLEELKSQRENYTATLVLEEQALEVAEGELQRAEELHKRNAGSGAEVDAQKRSVFSQRQSVQSVKSNLNLVPSKILAAEASILVAKSALAEEERNLGRTEIHAPFNCRIGPVDLELSQFVNSGESLFESQSTDKFEIEAQVAVSNLRKLFDEDLRRQDVSDKSGALSQSLIKRYFNVKVNVRYEVGGTNVQRTATFERIRERLDSQTRMSGVVVSIKDPYVNLEGGPPPVSGTFCEVELRGKLRPNKVIVPRSAIQNGYVYIVDDDNRLARRPVTISWRQSDFAVIDDGLKGGERLVVSDPTPAIEQMLVDPVNDDVMAKRLTSQASGQGGVR